MMSGQSLPARLKLFVVGLFIFLIVGLFIAVFISMNILVGSWAWTLVAILLGLFLFLIINRTPLRHKLLPILEIFFPIISKLQEEAQRRFENRSIVDKMEYTLNHYKLFWRVKEKSKQEASGGRIAFSSKFHQTLVDTLLTEPNKKNHVPACSNRTSMEMEQPVTPIILTIFYRDLHETPNRMDYEVFTQSDNDSQSLRTELANILEESTLLPDRFPCTADDISRFLQHYEKYELNRLVDDMRKLQKVWALTSSCLDFLIKNKVLADDLPYTVNDLINTIDDASEAFPTNMSLPERFSERQTVSLIALKEVGRRAMITGFGSLSVDECESLNLIALAMFLTEERKDLQDLRITICEQASQSDIALQQHLAYLEYREDLREATTLGGLDFVSVRYIADHWRQTVEKRKKELGAGFDKELIVIRDNLQEGNWWTRLRWVIDDALKTVLEEVKVENEKFARLVLKRPLVDEVLRRIFRGLKLETIERFLESRTFIAYLLTFDVEEGGMAGLIDTISFFKGDKYRTQLTRFGIRFTYKDREKYIFKDYIKQCRIGLIPLGMSFNEFVNEFEHDLAIAYTNREALELPNPNIDKFEAIIHRFGLSGRDRHGLEKFHPEGQKQHALPRIQELLASSLFSEDVLALICYEREPEGGRIGLEPVFDDILMFGTIVDFIGDTLPDITQRQKDALNKNNDSIRTALLQETKCGTIKVLSRSLSTDMDKQMQAKSILSQLLGDCLQLPENSPIPDQISSIYIDTLADIGSLYGTTPN